MPMALCRPDRSSLEGMKAMVASPGVPPSVNGGMKNLIIDSDLRSEYVGREWTCEGLKYFIPRILLAAAGSAKMVVTGEDGSN